MGQKNDNGCVNCEIGTYQTMDYHRQESCVSCDGIQIILYSEILSSHILNTQVQSTIHMNGYKLHKE